MPGLACLDRLGSGVKSKSSPVGDFTTAAARRSNVHLGEAGAYGAVARNGVASTKVHGCKVRRMQEDFSMAPSGSDTRSGSESQTSNQAVARVGKRKSSVIFCINSINE